MTDTAAIPLLDLKAQYQSIAEEVRAVIDRVCVSQQFILGPEVTALETELATYCGAEHAVGVSSGTDALLLALMALDVGPGDEIITSAYSFFATAGAIARLGATPVFADIDATNYNLDPSKIEMRITTHTKAIMPVHLYGQCADMDAIMAISNQYGLPVIEDACQAIGAEDHNRRAGSIGLMGCFSFFPSKNLGCFGDAGAITTNDSDLAERLKKLRVHGSKVRYYHDEIGGNFRIDALQAAVLRVKLRHLDKWTAARQQNALLYEHCFSESGIAGARVTTPRIKQSRHVYNQYVVRCVNRDAVWDHLKTHQIGAEVYYPVPLHMQQCFAHLGHRPNDFPESRRAAATTLALPIYPELPAESIRRVAATVADYYHSAGLLSHRRAA